MLTYKNSIKFPDNFAGTLNDLMVLDDSNILISQIQVIPIDLGGIIEFTIF